MQTWTTADLPSQDRFSYWREVLCQTYVALDPICDVREDFTGSVSACSLAAINVTTIASGRQRIVRGRPEISRMPSEVYFLNLQVAGQCRMLQGGREALIRPGEFAIADSTEPYVVDYCSDDWKQFSFRIPKHLLDPLLSRPGAVTATRISGAAGVGAVAVECLTSITRNAAQLSSLGERLGPHMIDLVALALGAGDSTVEERGASMRRGWFDAIVQHIVFHVADPELSPGKVAKHFNVSTRYIHKVLEEGDRSFGRLLLESRLDRSAATLLEAPRETIATVAMRWGFNDLSHFSRTFRQRFGMSPREYRATAGTCSLFNTSRPGPLPVPGPGRGREMLSLASA